MILLFVLVGFAQINMKVKFRVSFINYFKRKRVKACFCGV